MLHHEKDGGISFGSYHALSTYLKIKAENGTWSVKFHIEELRLSVLFSLAYVPFHQYLFHQPHTPPAEAKHVSVNCTESFADKFYILSVYCKG